MLESMLDLLNISSNSWYRKHVLHGFLDIQAKVIFLDFISFILNTISSSYCHTIAINTIIQAARVQKMSPVSFKHPVSCVENTSNLYLLSNQRGLPYLRWELDLISS